MKEYSTYIYVAIITAVIMVVAYFVGRAHGKSIGPPSIPVPEDTVGGGAPSYDPKPLTDRLYKDIDGLKLKFQRDWDAWLELQALSDTNIVKVMNDWDARYYNVWRETLAQAYDKEYVLTMSTMLKSLPPRFERLEKLRK